MASSKSSSGASAQKVTKLSRTHMVQYADVELRNYDGEFLLALFCWRGALNGSDSFGWFFIPRNDNID